MDVPTMQQQINKIINELRVRDDTADCIAKLAELGPLSELQVYEALVAIRNKTEIPLRVLDPMYVAERAIQMGTGITWPFINERNGKPISSYANFKHLCDTNDIVLQENLMTHECDAMIDGIKTNEQGLLNYALEKGLAGYKNTIAAVSKRLAEGTKPYHPVVKWLEGKEWDGEDRIEQLIYKLNVQQCPDKLVRIYLTRWLLGGIECAYESEGVGGQSMLVLQGKSGCGKTAFFTDLMPQLHESEWFGNAGRTPWDKRLYEATTKKWLLEFASFQEYLVYGHRLQGRRTNLTDVSSFLNKNKDDTGQLAPFNRRMFFCAGITTKKDRIAYSADRHYFVIPIGEIKYNLVINARQLWLQVKQLYDDGQRHRLLTDEFKSHMRYAEIVSTRPHWIEERQGKTRNG